MQRSNVGRWTKLAGSLALLCLALGATQGFAADKGRGDGHRDGHGGGRHGGAPRYTVDPHWPKPLPFQWIVGQVGGVAVDQDDNVWIVQRALSLTDDEAWATEAIAYRCDDGALQYSADTCADGSTAVPIDGLGNPRPDGPEADCCKPAPAVMQFDRDGNLLRAWGGPADPGFIGPHGQGEPGCDPAQGCQWPAGEHGIYVDRGGFVYLAGNGTGTGLCGAVTCPWAPDHGVDGMVLKFSANGTFIYQIGGPDPQDVPDSNDRNGAMNGTPQLYRPADMEVDPDTNELFIADGYGNHRVLVVDADSGQYLRHWGGYGQHPVDDEPDESAAAPGPDPNFKNPVHCVRIVDELVYVCDRVNNRIQVFDKTVVGAPCANPDGRPGVCGFVEEKFIAADTLGNGSTWDVDTSPDEDQSCLFNPDGTNEKIWILDRESLAILDTFGNAGRGAGQFHWLHNLAIDSAGYLYTAEVDTGKRAQKFRPRGRGGVACR